MLLDCVEITHAKPVMLSFLPYYWQELLIFSLNFGPFPTLISQGADKPLYLVKIITY